MNLGMSMVLSNTELELVRHCKIKEGDSIVVVPTVIENDSVENLKEKIYEVVNKMFAAMENNKDKVTVTFKW